MTRRKLLVDLAALGLAAAASTSNLAWAQAGKKEVVYITPSVAVPFWRYVATGVEAGGKADGLTVTTMSSNNSAATQLQNVQAAIAKGVSGIVISPVDSSSAPEALALAEKAGIPVVICDIGTTGGNYTSFVGSDNLSGSKGVGEAAVAELAKRGWKDGSYGIIGIPQSRKNGQLRTEGFRSAMSAAGFKKEAPMQEMKTFTADESSKFAQEMMAANPDLRLIFVQADTQALGVMKAVKAAKKSDSVLVAAFDGTPELLSAIVSGGIIGSGMQQPYLMGAEASKALASKLSGGAPKKDIVIPILTVTATNAKDNMSNIKLNVFANSL